MKNALFLLLAVAFAASIVGYRNFARVEHRVFISWFFRKNAVIFFGVILAFYALAFALSAFSIKLF